MEGPTALVKIDSIPGPEPVATRLFSVCPRAKLVGAKQGDATALETDVPERREATQCPVDVFTTSTHQTGKVSLRELHRVALRCRQVQELPGDAAGNVEESKLGKGFIFGAHICAERRDDLPHRRRTGLQEFPQGSSVENQALCLRQRLRVGAPRSVLFQDADLAKYVAGVQDREGDFAPRFGYVADLDLTVGDEVKLVGRIALAKYV